jgi:transcriptional regulator with XRE-family HTH domain
MCYSGFEDRTSMKITNPGKDARLSIEIGNRLKKLRLEKGLTQKVLAAKVRDGVDYTYIGKIERGEQLPSLKVLLRISETLSVPIHYFFRDEADTVVYLDSSAELGFLLRDGKGRELLNTLKLLHTGDIPLIMEIVKILARQKNSEKPEKTKDRGYPADDLLPAAKKDTLFLEK